MADYPIRNVVLDPVMVATSGDKLLLNEAIDHLKVLFPKVKVITPNLPEAEILLARKIERQSEFRAVTQELAEEFKVSILLKAGHLKW